MIKWCDRCPREANSCDDCKKSRFGFKNEPKLTKEEKKRLREKAKEKIRKRDSSL